jgi:hypothetical protein
LAEKNAKKYARHFVSQGRKKDWNINGLRRFELGSRRGGFRAQEIYQAFSSADLTAHDLLGQERVVGGATGVTWSFGKSKPIGEPHKNMPGIL